MDNDFGFVYDKDALSKFVEKILKKHNIYNVDAHDMADMIVDAVQAEVMKKKTGNVRQMTFGIDDGQLEQAICKAYPYLKEWKKSKVSEQRKEYKDNQKKKAATSVATPTYNSNGKKILRKPKKEEPVEELVEEPIDDSFGDFDIEQLELF